MINDAGSPPPLGHLAYLEALADAAGAADHGARWSVVSAGYATLQLFEVWAGFHRGALTPDEIEIRRVRRRIESVHDADPIRRCLQQLVELIERAVLVSGVDEHRECELAAARIVAAYGKLLQYEASWSLARDVFSTLAAFARLVDDEERLLDSMLMIGFCHRMLAEFDDAREAYGRLRALASQLGSEQYLLLSELGFAKIAIERGNLPAAVGMLDQLITETEADEHAAIRAKALMDRARVAAQMGDHTSAVVLGHEALQCSADPMERERILINLAMTLRELGLWDQARDANVILAATAQEAAVRWMAQINLMALATLTHDAPMFDAIRREVSAMPLPPYLRTLLHEASAHGLRAFGQPAESTLEFRRMLDVAERHGLHEFIVKAREAQREASDSANRPALAQSTSMGDVTPEVARVARTITAMRALAGL